MKAKMKVRGARTALLAVVATIVAAVLAGGAFAAVLRGGPDMYRAALNPGSTRPCR